MDQCVGYKEWVGVCGALLEGRQQVLLRKGGIHEGRKGFSFRHDSFALFPTRFHAQAAQIRDPQPLGGKMQEWEVGEEVFFEVWCEAVWARTLTDWNQVKALEPFHVWTEDLVRERFDCGDVQQIHCALVRVYRLIEPFTLPYAKGYGGCRTWVNLPSSPPRRMEPVVEDSVFEESRTAIETILS
ncbi:MAG: DUF1802 family protein [Roseibacillus sp.]|nr:DUF1802 family protein [Roseibacillus sp.]